MRFKVNFKEKVIIIILNKSHIYWAFFVNICSLFDNIYMGSLMFNKN